MNPISLLNRFDQFSFNEKPKNELFRQGMFPVKRILKKYFPCEKSFIHFKILTRDDNELSKKDFTVLA